MVQFFFKIFNTVHFIESKGYKCQQQQRKFTGKFMCVFVGPISSFNAQLSPFSRLVSPLNRA